MSDFDTRPSLNASSAAAVAGGILNSRAPSRKKRLLTTEAIAVAARPGAEPVSSICLAGFVRIGQFALIVPLGVALLVGFFPPLDGVLPRFLAATLGIALFSPLAFQGADIYQVQAFRGYEK